MNDQMFVGLSYIVVAVVSGAIAFISGAKWRSMRIIGYIHFLETGEMELSQREKLSLTVDYIKENM